MAADERLEKLLNHFGQTISDLPKPTEEGYAYEKEHRRSAREAALKWSDVNYAACPFLNDYICHLADVIDKMEIALETALNVMHCETCVNCAKAECRDCSGDMGDVDQYRILD